MRHEWAGVIQSKCSTRREAKTLCEVATGLFLLSFGLPPPLFWEIRIYVVAFKPGPKSEGGRGEGGRVNGEEDAGISHIFWPKKRKPCSMHFLKGAKRGNYVCSCQGYAKSLENSKRIFQCLCDVIDIFSWDFTTINGESFCCVFS